MDIPVVESVPTTHIRLTWEESYWAPLLESVPWFWSLKCWDTLLLVKVAVPMVLAAMERTEVSVNIPQFYPGAVYNENCPQISKSWVVSQKWWPKWKTFCQKITSTPRLACKKRCVTIFVAQANTPALARLIRWRKWFLHCLSKRLPVGWVLIQMLN